MLTITSARLFVRETSDHPDKDMRALIEATDETGKVWTCWIRRASRGFLPRLHDLISGILRTDRVVDATLAESCFSDEQKLKGLTVPSSHERYFVHLDLPKPATDREVER